MCQNKEGTSQTEKWQIKEVKGHFLQRKTMDTKFCWRIGHSSEMKTGTCKKEKEHGLK